MKWKKTCPVPMVLMVVVMGMVMAVCLTACGSSSGRTNASSDASSAYYTTEAPVMYEKSALYDDDYVYYSDYDYDEPETWNGTVYGMSAGSALLSSRTNRPDGTQSDVSDFVTQPRKLIRRAEMRLETTEFDETADALSALTEEFDGYFSYANVGGSSYRYADYTIRIPEQHFETFLNRAGELAHETRRSVSQDDVSEMYYDTQGRLRTQNIKLERLQALLEQAETAEDLITIESAISETEERIEELSGTLRHYDNLVEYATVEVSLSEVYRLSNVEPVPEGYFTRLGTAFVDGLRSFGETLEDLTIDIAYGWIWLVILVAFIVFGVKLIRGKLPRLRNKAESKAPVTSGQSPVDAHFQPDTRSAQNPQFPADTRSAQNPQSQSDAQSPKDKP